MQRATARERWERLISEQSRSGLSVAEFCRRRDLAQASFYQWRKKLRQAQNFVPVSVVGGAAVQVEFPCGAVLRVPVGDPPTLKQVVSLLIAGVDGGTEA